MSERARALEQAQAVKEPCPHCGRTDYRWTHEFRVGLSFSPEDRLEVRCDYCRPLRMEAYYFSFSETGVEAIDRILSAVAHAGKGYHHTESWGDEDLEDMGEFHGGSYVAWIQNAANDAAKLEAVNPPPSGASPQAEELRAANVANLREMVGMAGRHREALLAVRECILALSPGHRTGYDWNADPLFLTLKEGRALNLIDDALKAAPASPQAETSANVRALTVHICDDCLNLRGEMCNEPGCRFCRRTMAEVAEHLDALLIRPRIDGVSVLVDEGAPLPAPVSPVEPEPPTTFVAKESDAYLTYAARHLRHAVDKADDAPASSAQHEKQALFALTHERIPTHEEALNVWVEPEPCVWRADWREGRDGSILVPSCQPEMEIDAAFVQECVKLHGWKFCTHCGAPLKVEKP